MISKLKSLINKAIHFKKYKDFVGKLRGNESLFRKFSLHYANYQQLSPFEFFDYYAVFYYWVSKTLLGESKSKKKVLVLGGEVG